MSKELAEKIVALFSENQYDSTSDYQISEMVPRLESLLAENIPVTLPPSIPIVVAIGLDEIQSYLDAELQKIQDLLSPKWIPVSERLPDNDIPVLVTVNAEYNKTRRTVFVQMQGYCEGDWETEDVTHWMPLPAAAEVGE